MKNYTDIIYEAEDLGEHNDCTVIALSIATNTPYSQMRDMLKDFGRKPGARMKHNSFMDAVYALINPSPKIIKPRKANGGKYTPVTIGRYYSKGTYLCFTSGHVFCLKDGEVQDWTAGRRHRILEMIECN